MIAESTKGMYIHVKVIAGARNESFEHIKDAHFSVSVRQKAEMNLANRRVLELVSQHFRIPSRSARIISGHHSPSKLISIPDLNGDQ